LICNGFNNLGQTDTPKEITSDIGKIKNLVNELVTGPNTTCIRFVSGKTSCWGDLSVINQIPQSLMKNNYAFGMGEGGVCLASMGEIKEERNAGIRRNTQMDSISNRKNNNKRRKI